MSDVFISYSHKDTSYAHKLANILEKKGLSVWIDDRIDYGTEWPQVIRDSLKNCAAFIVIMTPHSDTSVWVKNELALARNEAKLIFPLLLEGASWWEVDTIQFADVTDNKLPPQEFFITLKSKILNLNQIQKNDLDINPPVPIVPKAKWHISTLPKWARISLAVIFIVLLAGILISSFLPPNSLVSPVFGSNKPLIGFAFSPNGDSLVSASCENKDSFKLNTFTCDDRSVKIELRNLTSGTIERVSSQNTDAVSALAFDGKKIAYSDQHSFLFLVDVAGFQLTKPIQGGSPILGLVFGENKDGEYLVSGDKGGFLWKYDTNTLVSINAFGSMPLKAAIDLVITSHDGNELAIIDHNSNVYFFSLDTNPITPAPISFPGGGNHCTMAFTPNDDMLDMACVLPNGTINAYLLQVSNPRFNTLSSYITPISTPQIQLSKIQLSPDDKLLAFGSIDGRVGVWDRNTGNIVFQPQLIYKDGSPVNHLGFNWDHKILVTGSSNTIESASMYYINLK